MYLLEGGYKQFFANYSVRLSGAASLHQKKLTSTVSLRATTVHAYGYGRLQTATHTMRSSASQRLESIAKKQHTATAERCRTDASSVQRSWWSIQGSQRVKITSSSFAVFICDLVLKLSLALSHVDIYFARPINAALVQCS